MKYFKKDRTILLLLVIGFVFFMGCKNSKTTFENKNEINRTSKIIFLNYNIEKDANGNRNIQFINKKIVDGNLKNKPSLILDNGIKGDLTFTELDKKGKVLQQILIRNPLNKTVEYVDESKQFQNKTIKLNKAQFSVRLQLKSNTKYITISNFAENKPLIKTQIN